jgi:hypothetical protein
MAADVALALVVKAALLAATREVAALLTLQVAHDALSFFPLINVRLA